MILEFNNPKESKSKKIENKIVNHVKAGKKYKDIKIKFNFIAVNSIYDSMINDIRILYNRIAFEHLHTKQSI